MPIYEYKCNECNEEFEYLVLGSGEEVVCPACKGSKVERLLSACRFKSGGGGDSFPSAGGGGSSCSGCTSTNCSSCH